MCGLNLFDDVVLPDLTLCLHCASQEPQFAQRLPAWWTTALGDADSFVIAPLLSKSKPVALLYGDWVNDLPPQLGREHFAALDELRTLAAKACTALKRASNLREAARVQLARVGT